MPTFEAEGLIKVQNYPLTSCSQQLKLKECCVWRLGFKHMLTEGFELGEVTLCKDFLIRR